jgi:glycosyltransferase involved in cell wall biosynthesis
VHRDAALYLGRRILPRVRRSVPGAELLVIGPGPSRLLRQLSHLPGVRLSGLRASFQAALSEAQVVVHPLRADAGFPVAIVKAIACGRPVIASPLVVDALGLRADDPILVAESASEFAARTAALLQHPHVAESLGGRGRRLVLERFDLRAVAQRLDDILHQLVPQPPARHAAVR